LTGEAKRVFRAEGFLLKTRRTGLFLTGFGRVNIFFVDREMGNIFHSNWGTYHLLTQKRNSGWEEGVKKVLGRVLGLGLKFWEICRYQGNFWGLAGFPNLEIPGY